jgi:uncharacterized protein YktB (UPF0637 family)
MILILDVRNGNSNLYQNAHTKVRNFFKRSLFKIFFFQTNLFLYFCVSNGSKIKQFMFHIFKKNKSAFINVTVPSITQAEKWAKSQPKDAAIAPVSPKTNAKQPISVLESNRLEEICV